MKLLIVELPSLGDAVHAMAAVQDIRRVRPEAQIDWVVRSREPCAQALAQAASVAEVTL